MAVETLLLSPEQENYTIEFGSFTTGSRKDSPAYVLGAGYRTQTVKIPVTIIAEGSEQVPYFQAFFDTAAKRGAKPFYMNLPIKSSTPALYLCLMEVASYQMTVLSGEVHRFDFIVNAAVS